MTALQELIKYHNDLQGYEKSLESFNLIGKAIELLEIEKQQILDAFNEGKNNSVDYFIPNIDFRQIIPESEIYFKQTYDNITTTNE